MVYGSFGVLDFLGGGVMEVQDMEHRGILRT